MKMQKVERYEALTTNTTLDDCYIELRELLSEIEDIVWLSNIGSLPTETQLFTRRQEAIDLLIKKDGRDALLNTAYRDIENNIPTICEKDAIRHIVSNEILKCQKMQNSNQAYSDYVFICSYILNYVYIKLFCDEIVFNKEVIDYVTKCWDIISAGHGVAGDINGILYCYKECN